jgi:hypothetical protein
MHHYHLGIDLSDRAEQAEADFERLSAQVAAELTLEAIQALPDGKPVTYFNESKQAEVYEDVDRAFLDYVDQVRTTRLRDMVKALHAAAEGKPEARLQAMALIAGFASDRAAQFADAVARARMNEEPIPVGKARELTMGEWLRAAGEGA